MHEQVAVLENITHRLEQADIPYMLSGSTAMNYYAQPRMTRDIDLVVEIQTADTVRLAVQLGEDYYFDEEAAQTAIEHQSLFNLLHQASLVKIDCIVRKSHPYRQAEFSRRRQVDFGDFLVWIVSPEDLLLSKLDWLKDSRSEMQFRDVRNLIASVPQLDWAYLYHWADRLGLLPLLEEARF
ncbi:MAG: nucleotidyl transferase AbiEii/AbiGii toxin family protein [Candidatus Contendobacter sp.]|nr:nucleotidyl transferase AbiEii/AbiGii toxin family protein [Candidatus Contendobacter sp.]